MVRAQDELATKIIGQWREQEPGENLVEFAKGGVLKIFMKKGDSDTPRPRVLEGTWQVTKDGTLTITVTFLGRTMPPKTAKISFEGEDLIITDRQKVRHHRHTGPLPAEYQW